MEGNEDQAVSPLSEAESFEQFKKLRHPEPKTAESAASAESAEKTTQAEEAKPKAAPETAAASETAETNTQEKQPTGTVEDRVKDLRAQGKHAVANKLMAEEAARHRERAEQLENDLKQLRQEFETLRSRPSEQQQPKADPKPQAAVAPAVDPSDPMPALSDEKYQKEGGFVDFQQELARWTFRQEQKRVSTEAAQNARREKVQKIMSDGAAAHPDFSEVTARAVINKSVLHDGLEAIPNFGEVLYALGSNPGELARVQKLSPPDQWYEVRKLGYELATKAAAPAGTPAATEPTPNLRPAVTKVSPPPRVLNGARGGEDEPVKLSEARSFDEFKQMRHRKRA